MTSKWISRQRLLNTPLSTCFYNAICVVATLSCGCSKSYIAATNLLKLHTPYSYAFFFHSEPLTSDGNGFGQKDGIAASLKNSVKFAPL